MGEWNRSSVNATTLAAVAATALLCSPLLLIGCGDDFTPENVPATGTGTATGGSTGSGGTGGDTATGGGGMGAGGIGGTGGGGGSPIECIPSEATQTVDDSCGLFVATGGDDQNLGTKASPKKTIAGALSAVTAGQAIYLCAETFAEAVTIDMMPATLRERFERAT